MLSLLLPGADTNTGGLFCGEYPVHLWAKGEPTSGLEPLTCSLRVSSFPTQNPLEMAVLQALLALLCPPRIRKCRQISPLLLTLLLTIADASSLGSPSPLFCRVTGNTQSCSGDAGTRTIAITMDTYSHVLPNLQQDAVERLGALLMEKT